MLLHFNPSTPHFYTFTCPHTMATAVVNLDAETLHPVVAPQLGSLSTEHCAAITATMSTLCGESFQPRITPGAVNLPEWLVFYKGENLLIMHTASPAFICPMSTRLRVISPITDNPTIPLGEVAAWLAKAQQAFDEMKPALLAL